MENMETKPSETALLSKDFHYFLDNYENLISKYEGRTLVIKDLAVVGDFENFRAAYSWAMTNFIPGTFLIQLCSRDKSSYILKVHNRFRY